MKYLRLKKNNDFQKLFKKGKRVFSSDLTILYTQSKKTIMGIALSKKHGKAVKRNRIKRLIRAAFANNIQKLNGNFSIVILPKVKDEYSYKSIEKSILYCFSKMN
jgi:ribonuclease P protein component